MQLLIFISIRFIGLIMSSTKKEFVDFSIRLEEICNRATKEASERTGKQVTTSTLILDFEHLSMKKMTSKIGKIHANNFCIAINWCCNKS